MLHDFKDLLCHLHSAHCIAEHSPKVPHAMVVLLFLEKGLFLAVVGLKAAFSSAGELQQGRMGALNGFVKELNGEGLIRFDVSHCEVEKCAVEVEEGAVGRLLVEKKIGDLWTEGNAVLAGVYCLETVTESNRLCSPRVVEHLHREVVFHFFALI